VISVGPAGAPDDTTTVIDGLVAFGETPFDAVTLNVKLPPTDGVPDKTPLAESKLNPVGRLPDTLNVGAGLPDATNVYGPYTLPTVPATGGESALNTGATAADAVK
jgi:hypothetical protein